MSLRDVSARWEWTILTLQVIPRLVQWHQEGKFPVGKMVKVYPAEELGKALEDLKAGTVRLLCGWNILTL